MSGQAAESLDDALDDEQQAIRRAFEEKGRGRIRQAFNPMLDPARLEVRFKVDLDFSKMQTDGGRSPRDKDVALTCTHRTEPCERDCQEPPWPRTTTILVYRSVTAGRERRAVIRPAAIDRILVDVVVDGGWAPEDATALDVLRQLAMSTIDIDPTRGDEVHVSYR